MQKQFNTQDAFEIDSHLVLSQGNSRRPPSFLNQLKFRFLTVLFLCVSVFINPTSCAVSPTFSTSNRYIRTGVYSFDTLPYYNVSVPNVDDNFTISLGTQVMSAGGYMANVVLPSMTLHYQGRQLSIEIEVVDTQPSNMTVAFRSDTADKLQMLDVGYICVDPSYNMDEFYIQNIKHKDLLTGASNYSGTWPITSSSPAWINNTQLAYNLSSLFSVKSILLLNGFRLLSQYPDPGINLDIYPSVTFTNTSHIDLKFQTAYNDMTMKFYSVCLVYYVENTVLSHSYSRFVVDSADNDTSNADINYQNSGVGDLTQSSVFVGMSSFHFDQSFVNFETFFINSSYIDFNTTNDIFGKYLKFELLVVQSFICPSTEPFLNTNTQLCVNMCPSGEYGLSSESICVTTCPSSYLMDDAIRECLTSCRSGTYQEGYSCVSTCSNNTFGDNSTGNCEANCANGTYADNSTSLCETGCANNTFGNNDTNSCQTNCPSNSYADDSINICVSNCPDGTYASDATYECVGSCPNGTYASDLTNQCVTDCPNGTYSYDLTNECVVGCPNGTFADDSIQTCAYDCPNATYASDATNECVDSCPNGAYASDATNQCVTNCPNSTYSSDLTNECLSDCPNGTYSSSASNKCVNTCPDSTFADDSSGQCVSVCPTRTYEDTTTNTCVSVCPSGTFISNLTTSCVSQCPSPQTQPDLSTGYCEKNCTYVSVGCQGCYLSTYDESHDMCYDCGVSSVSGYELDASSDKCVGICGDAILVDGESCEDGNLDDGDGCSSTCEVESGYDCTAVNISTGLSECQLIANDEESQSVLSASYKYALKHETSNTVDVFLELSSSSEALVSAYSKVDWSKAVISNSIALQESSDSYQVEYIDEPKPHLKITIKYNETLESTDREFSLAAYNPDVYPEEFGSFTGQTVALSGMTSQNNLKLEVYDEDEYQMASTVRTVAGALGITYLAMFFAGTIVGKLFILEMASVAQIAVMNLILLTEITPTFSGLTQLIYALGYHYVPSSSDYQSEVISENFGLLGLTQYFCFNFNLMLVFVLFTLFMGLLFSCIESGSSCKEKEWEKVKFTWVFENIFYFIAWFMTWIGLGMWLQLIYIGKATSTSDLIFSLVLMGICLLGIVLYLVVFMKSPSRFGDFYTHFMQKNSNMQSSRLEPNSPLSNRPLSERVQQESPSSVKQNREPSMLSKTMFYVAILLSKLVASIVFASTISLQFALSFILAIQASMLILVCIFRPYVSYHNKDANQTCLTRYSNIRPIVNYSVSILLCACYLSQNMFLSESESTFSRYLPLLILGILLLHFLFSLVYIVPLGWHDLINIKRTYRNIFDEQQRKEQYKSDMKKMEEMLEVSQIKKNLLKRSEGNFMNAKLNQTPENQTKYSKKDNLANILDAINDENLDISFENKHDLSMSTQNRSMTVDEMISTMSDKKYLKLTKTGGDLKLLKGSENDDSDVLSPEVSIKAQWEALQDVDSSRMDKLLKFNQIKASLPRIDEYDSSVSDQDYASVSQENQVLSQISGKKS